MYVCMYIHVCVIDARTQITCALIGDWGPMCGGLFLCTFLLFAKQKSLAFITFLKQHINFQIYGIHANMYICNILQLSDNKSRIHCLVYTL